jgi:hypothetical protein
MSEPRSPTAAAPEETDRRTGADRREWPRASQEALATVKAQLAAGTEVDLKDLSRGGARFQTETRLLPGLTVAVRLVGVDGKTTTVRGRVVRSRLLRLDRGGMGYEVGIAFQELISPVVDEMTQAAPTGSAAPAPVAPEPGATATAEPAPAKAPAIAAPPPAESLEPAPMLLTAAVLQSTPELRDLFTGNDW